MVQACPLTVTAGGYVLGVLDPQETSEFHEHTEECPYCRREVLELSSVVTFLAPLKAERQWLSAG